MLVRLERQRGCAMLVRLERQRGCVYSSQYFKTVEEMVAYI